MYKHHLGRDDPKSKEFAMIPVEETTIVDKSAKLFNSIS
jgi:hypothetical protein